MKASHVVQSQSRPTEHSALLAPPPRPSVSPSNVQLHVDESQVVLETIAARDRELQALEQTMYEYVCTF